MINQNWWFTTLLVKQFQHCPPLNKDIKCDVVIVGGGMSGISAAAEFLRSGLKVVLIDKNIVGGSSTGKSAGFLTPDSELELHQLVRRYGIDAARDIWEMPCTCLVIRAVGSNVDRAATDLMKAVTPAEAESWTTSTPIDWANESFAIAERPEAKYCSRETTTCVRQAGSIRIDRAYIEANAPVIRERLQRAGIRLSRLLDAALAN